MNNTLLIIDKKDFTKLVSKNPVVGNIADHIGDMYCIRALMTLFPEVNCLILYKKSNELSKNNLNIMYNYLSSGNRHERVSIGHNNLTNLNKFRIGLDDAIKTLKNQNRIPAGLFKESGANSYLTAYALLKGQTRLKSIIVDGMTGEESDANDYKNDLMQEGGFPAASKKGNYILVNYRLSGQSKKRGVHPCLDTGEVGMKQILTALKNKYEDVTIVPIGEFKPDDWQEYPTLVNYWDWPSTSQNRSKQVGLLKYLNQNYQILGVIGMRSGVIDLFAFLGFKVISIDRNSEQGIERAYKTQKGLGKLWFRVVEIMHPRENEKLNDKGNAVSNWKGIIHEADLENIITATEDFF